MMLYAKALLKASCHVFEIFQDAGDIQTPEHVRLLMSYSTFLQRALYGKSVAACDMPIQVSSMEFSLARIEAEKKAFVREKLLSEDKYWQRRLIRDFGIKLHKSLFVR